MAIGNDIDGILTEGFDYKHIDFTQVVKLLDRDDINLSEEFRSIFPIGKERDTSKPYYLDSGNNTLESDELKSEINRIKMRYPHGPTGDHHSPSNKIIDKKMNRFLRRIGATDDKLVLIMGGCTHAMHELVDNFKFNPDGKILIPSRSYIASQEAVEDKEYEGIEIRVAKELGIRLNMEDLRRSGRRSHNGSPPEPNFDDTLQLVIIQSGSNMYGTQARLGSHGSSRVTRDIDGIVEEILRHNIVREQHGIPPIGVIIDDAASRQCMGWVKPNGNYTQLRLDDFSSLPVAICYSLHKAYGVLTGGVAVMNEKFLGLTKLKPRSVSEDPKLKWRQFMHKSVAYNTVDHPVSLDYGLGLIERVGLDRLMAHNIRSVYRLVELLQPLIDSKKIDLLSPEVILSGTDIYDEKQKTLIDAMQHPGNRHLISNSRINPAVLSFNTVTFGIPNKTSDYVTNLARSLRIYGLQISDFDLRESQPFHSAKYDHVLRISTALYNNDDDLLAASRYLEKRLNP